MRGPARTRTRRALDGQVAELKEMLAERGLKVSGRKAELIQRPLGQRFRWVCQVLFLR